MVEGQTPKKALITGISGQDGSYLAELLISKGYHVTGLLRRASQPNTQRLAALMDNPQTSSQLLLRYADLSDGLGLYQYLDQAQPDEVYHLGAQSHVKMSFEAPIYTGDVTGLGTLRWLEAIRLTGRPIKFYNASSSEMFGGSAPSPQNEQTSFHPRSPYGCAKVYSYWSTVNYRESYGLFACNGILFNHESPRRSESFVTRKITRGLARILAGKQTHITLGNLSAQRDWGYAPEYVEAMWRMLQQPEPDDYVIATGQSHSVQQLLQTACNLINLDWQTVVKTDPHYLRPSEVDHLVGDASKAARVLGWHPTTYFEDLVKLMLAADLTLEGLEVPWQPALMTHP